MAAPATVDVRLNRHKKQCDTCTAAINPNDVYIHSNQKFFHIECTPGQLVPSLRALRGASGIRDFPAPCLARLVFASAHVALAAVQEQALHADLQWNSQVLMHRAMKEDSYSVLPSLSAFTQVFAQKECCEWLVEQLTKPEPSSTHNSHDDVAGIYAPKRKFKCGDNYVASLILCIPKIAESISDWPAIIQKMGEPNIEDTIRLYIGHVLKKAILHRTSNVILHDALHALLKTIGESSCTVRDLLVLLVGRGKAKGDPAEDDDDDDDIRESDILYRRGLDPLVTDSDLIMHTVQSLVNSLDKALSSSLQTFNIEQMRIVRQCTYVLKAIFIETIGNEDDEHSRSDIGMAAANAVASLLNKIVARMCALPSFEVKTPRRRNNTTMCFPAFEVLGSSFIDLVKMGCEWTPVRHIVLPAPFWAILANIMARPGAQSDDNIPMLLSEHFKAVELVCFLFTQTPWLIPMPDAVSSLSTMYTALAHLLVAHPLSDILRVVALESLRGMGENTTFAAYLSSILGSLPTNDGQESFFSVMHDATEQALLHGGFEGHTTACMFKPVFVWFNAFSPQEPVRSLSAQILKDIVELKDSLPDGPCRAFVDRNDLEDDDINVSRDGDDWVEMIIGDSSPLRSHVSPDDFDNDQDDGDEENDTKYLSCAERLSDLSPESPTSQPTQHILSLHNANTQSSQAHGDKASGNKSPKEESNGKENGGKENVTDGKNNKPIGDSRRRAMDVHKDSPYLKVRSCSRIPNQNRDRRDSPYWRRKAMEDAAMTGTNTTDIENQGARVGSAGTSPGTSPILKPKQAVEVQESTGGDDTIRKLMF